MQGVYEGYGGNFTTIDYKTPHWNMLANIEKNVYQFSAAKNWHQLRDLTSALRDGDKIRSFSDFEKVARKVLDEYNGYMRPEYNTAVSGALNAAKWVEFEKNKRSMPNLKYVTVGDTRVRLEHQLLDGIIRPKDDSFWGTHYPPLAWNCRCTALELPGNDEVTPADKIPYVEIPKMFQVNLAKENLVFPKGSPYFDGCPKSALKEGTSLIPPKEK